MNIDKKAINKAKQVTAAVMRKVERYAKEINYLRSHVIAVGLPKETVGKYPNGIAVVDVGVIHEYGTIKIPERSWLRMPTTRFQKKISDALQFKLDDVANGKLTGKQAASRVGMVARNVIIDAFKSGGFGSWPDIEEETKDRKGSSGILKDTGKLIQSVTWVVRNASER